MNKEIEEILDYFRKYMCIEECIKLSKVEDYITNLQEENKRLEHDYKIALKLISRYEKRIDKANKKLESIRTFGLRSGKTLIYTLINESIDILQGSDKDE